MHHMGIGRTPHCKCRTNPPRCLDTRNLQISDGIACTVGMVLRAREDSPMMSSQQASKPLASSSTEPSSFEEWASARLALAASWVAPWHCPGRSTGPRRSLRTRTSTHGIRGSQRVARPGACSKGWVRAHHRMAVAHLWVGGASSQRASLGCLCSCGSPWHRQSAVSRPSR